MIVFFKTVFWFIVFKFQELVEFLMDIDYEKASLGFLIFIGFFMLALLIMLIAGMIMILIGFVVLNSIVFLTSYNPEMKDIKQTLANYLATGMISVYIVFVIRYINQENNIIGFLKDNWGKAKERANKT